MIKLEAGPQNEKKKKKDEGGQKRKTPYFR